MNLALVTPFYFPSVRGNSITVQRIESGLKDRGLEVRVFSLDRQDGRAILAGLRDLRPDVVHAFHATVAGPLAAEAAQAMGIPAVVTLTGTDVNQDLFDPGRRPIVLSVLEAAQAVVVFHASIGDALRREVPEVSAKLRVIAQSVRCIESTYDLRGTLGLRPGDFVFFQAAGIRRIKNIPSVFPPLTRLQAQCPNLRYVLAGPVIEPEEAARVTSGLRGYPWATYLGTLDHQDVCACLSSVEAAINSSLSEGGMSNAVLEAMGRGVPVLASRIQGNSSVILDGEDGFLYDSEEEFEAKAERLLREPGVRKAMGERAKRKVAALYGPDGEIGQHVALYRSVMAGARSQHGWT